MVGRGSLRRMDRMDPLAIIASAKASAYCSSSAEYVTLPGRVPQHDARDLVGRNIALRNGARLAAALDLTLMDLFARIERRFARMRHDIWPGVTEVP